MHHSPSPRTSVLLMVAIVVIIVVIVSRAFLDVLTLLDLVI